MMNKWYEYQTSIGPFYIAKTLYSFHAIYAETRIFSSTRADEIAAVLSHGYKFKLSGAEHCEIDTSNLKIPAKLSNWARCYYMPSQVSRNF